MKTQAQLKEFKLATTAKINHKALRTTLTDARNILTAECSAHGFNRKAIGVRFRKGSFEVI